LIYSSGDNVLKIFTCLLIVSAIRWWCDLKMKRVLLLFPLLLEDVVLVFL